MDINAKWIPVEKALPSDKKEDVLITVKGTTFPGLTVKTGMYFNDQWHFPSLYVGSFKVIAWMPIPKPYNPEKGKCYEMD